MNYAFGDIIVYEQDKIGVVVGSYIGLDDTLRHDCFIRFYNKIILLEESQIKRYLVRHKILDKEDLRFQYNAENNL